MRGGYEDVPIAVLVVHDRVAHGLRLGGCGFSFRSGALPTEWPAALATRPLPLFLDMVGMLPILVRSVSPVRRFGPNNLGKTVFFNFFHWSPYSARSNPAGSASAAQLFVGVFAHFLADVQLAPSKFLEGGGDDAEPERRADGRPSRPLRLREY